MNEMVFVDWGHKKENVSVLYKNEVRNTIPKLNAGDIIYTENIPNHIAKKHYENGVKILRCSGNSTAELRKEFGVDKSDEMDARIIWKLSSLYPEKFREWTPPSPLVSEYNLFKSIQESRKRISNQIWALGEENPLIDEMFKHFDDSENLVMKSVKKRLKKYPIYTKYLVNIKGIGPSTAGVLVGSVDKFANGIGDFNQASSFRHYFGVYPENGVAAKPTKGVNLTYKPLLKSMMLGVLGPSLIKARGFYKSFYDQYKEHRSSMVFDEGYLKSKFNGYKKSDTKLTKNHAHRQAQRKMVVLFLDHLWCIWRQLEGYSTRSPYPMEKLNHTGYIKPPYIPEELEPFDSFREDVN